MSRQGAWDNVVAVAWDEFLVRTEAWVDRFWDAERLLLERGYPDDAVIIVTEVDPT